VGVLEWVGAHLLAPFINLYRAISARPRPDVRIVELHAAGGGPGYIDFSVHVANYGTQQCRAEFAARIGPEPLECRPTVRDLIPNTPPEYVRVIVPRPALGELMSECNNETTLYGRTLTVVCSVNGKARAETPWAEHLYDTLTDRDRHEIQQRYWRRGRGEETALDAEIEARAERLRELESDEPDEGRTPPIPSLPELSAR
jgi:hypothetical protein